MNTQRMPRSFSLLSVLILAITVIATGCAGLLNAQNSGPSQNAQPPALPSAVGDVVAHGFVNADASIASGSMNVKRGSYNQQALHYEIPIDGVNYYYSEYTAIVTVSSRAAIFATTDSVDGKLVVLLHDLQGFAVEEDFQFVIYKHENL